MEEITKRIDSVQRLPIRTAFDRCSHMETKHYKACTSKHNPTFEPCISVDGFRCVFRVNFISISIDRVQGIKKILSSFAASVENSDVK